MDYDALERLVKLRDKKVLTDEEFLEQKQILLAGGAIDSGEAQKERQPDPASRISILQKRRAAMFALGLCAALYSTFIYDTTISPMDVPNPYSDVNAYSSVDERSRAISEISGRYNRLRAGIRYEDDGRVTMQRVIFWGGIVLMGLGGLSFLVTVSRNRR